MRVRIQQLAIALALVTLSAAPSVAQFSFGGGGYSWGGGFGSTLCLMTTAADCNDPDYFKTTCGEQALNNNQGKTSWICNQVWSGEHNAFAGQADVTVKDTMVPETTTDGAGVTTTQVMAVEAAAVQDYDTSTDIAVDNYACGTTRYNAPSTGSTGSTSGGFSAFGGSGFSFAPSPCGSTSKASFSPSAWYSWNGSAVASCEEYAFEKFNEVAIVLETMRAQKWSAREFVDAILDPSSPHYLAGDLSISSKSGQTQTAIPFSTCAPNNTYVQYLDFYNQLGFPVSCTPEDWSWHEQMSQAMSNNGWTDDILEYTRNKMSSFGGLWVKHDALEIENLMNIEEMLGGDPLQQWAAQQQFNQNQAGQQFLLQQMGDEIDFARNELGCVPSSPGQVTPCDWQPDMLYDEIVDHFEMKIAYARRSCERATGGKLSNLQSHFTDLFGAQVGPSGSGQQKNYLASAEMFDVFLADKAAHKNWLLLSMAQQLPIDAETGTVKTAESNLNEKSMGNDDFGIAYRTSSLVGLDFQSSADICQNGALLDTSVAATAGILGLEVELLDAAVAVKDGKATAHLRVMGQDLFNPINQSTTATFNIIKEHEVWKKDIQLAQATFPVFGIPLSVKAGVYGKIELGIDVDLHLGLQGGSNAPTPPPGCYAVINLDANVEPTVDAGAWASVSIDLVIVEVGIKGELSLLKVSLPLNAGVDLALTLSPNGQLDLHINPYASLDWTLSTLSGRIALFAKLNLIFTSLKEEVTLVRWKGPSWSGSVFDLEYPTSVPLSAIVAFNGW